MPHYITLHLRHDSIIKYGLGTYCLTLSARSIMLLNDNKDQLLLIGLRGIIQDPCFSNLPFITFQGVSFKKSIKSVTDRSAVFTDLYNFRHVPMIFPEIPIYYITFRFG